MLKLCHAVITLCLALNVGYADEADDQAKSFFKIYTSLCLKNLHNFGALREKLAPVPKLPPKQAAHFLVGREGEAWSVPDKHGEFVLALTDQNLCAVHARRANTQLATKLFTESVEAAPAPLTAILVQDERRQTSAHGQIHTMSYEWSTPDAPRRMKFTLTTASSDSAQTQALASAAVVSP